MSDQLPIPTDDLGPSRPFRRAVLRGLAVVLPPLLTIVIFVWVGNTVAVYLLEPLEDGARWALVTGVSDIREDLAIDNTRDRTSLVDGQVFKQVGDDKFVPLPVYQLVYQNRGDTPMPATARGIYRSYVELRYLKRYVVVPVFLCVFILFLYLLGKFLAAGVGKFFWHRFEQIIHRLPLVRNVYSSVKQVTDFLFSEREIEYTRVVAVEYPRKGIWSLGMVTGDSMLDIRSAANEAVLSVLVPTSPMPFTGFTVTVRKSETVDLNITIDQAFQFIVSCGVVVPPHQVHLIAEHEQKQAAAALTAEGSPAETTTVDGKTVEGTTVEGEAADGKGSEATPAGKSGEGQTPGDKASGDKASGDGPSDEGPAGDNGSSHPSSATRQES